MSERTQGERRDTTKSKKTKGEEPTKTKATTRQDDAAVRRENEKMEQELFERGWRWFHQEPTPRKPRPSR